MDTYDTYNGFDLFSNPAFVIPWLAVVILLIVAQWKVFTKAGQPGWACIIPIYNTYIMLKIGGKPWWWLLLFLIPGINIIFAIWMINMISKSFGHGEGFTIGLIIISVILWAVIRTGNS